MSIYTKTGDSGETSLFDGQRISKANARISLLGDLDELNAYLGLLISYLKSWKGAANLNQYNDKFLDFHLRFLEILQNVIFDVGAEIANPDLKNRVAGDYTSIVKRLEAAIDVMGEDMLELKNFILPGGFAGSAYTHIARAIARRCERHFVAISGNQLINESMGKFLNRLSDYLFMLARFLNKQAKVEDIIWRG